MFCAFVNALFGRLLGFFFVCFWFFFLFLLINMAVLKGLQTEPSLIFFCNA